MVEAISFGRKYNYQNGRESSESTQNRIWKGNFRLCLMVKAKSYL